MTFKQSQTISKLMSMLPYSLAMAMNHVVTSKSNHGK